jgi:hypothetical protein
MSRVDLHALQISLLLLVAVTEAIRAPACHPCVESHNLKDCSGGKCFGPCGFDSDWSKDKCDSCMLNCHEFLMRTKCAVECKLANVKMGIHLRKSCPSCQSENRRRCNWGECLQPCQQGAIACSMCVRKCTNRECADACSVTQWMRPHQAKDLNAPIADEKPAKESFICSLISAMC